MDSRTYRRQPSAGDEMSRPAAVVPPAKATIGEYGFRFCPFTHRGEPLLEVRAEASAQDVKEQAYMLIQTIGEVLGRALARGAEGDDDAALDTSTAYILRFAAEAAAAMVGSLEGALQVKP